MFAWPKKMLHVLEAAVYIAYNASSGPVSSKEIAGRQGVPPRYLEPMLQKLVRAGIMRGVRGPRGGYMLGRERRRVTVAEICAAVYDARDDAEGAPPTALSNVVLLPLMAQTQAALRESLAQVTLADLCDRAARGNVGRSREERIDFTI